MSSHPNLPAATDVDADDEKVGTPAYRARHISLLWSAQLWHEAIMIAACAVMLGLVFYTVAPKLVP